MNEITLIQALADMGTTIIFFWLFLRERARNAELQDQRFKDMRQWTETLIKLLSPNGFPDK